MLQPRPAQAVSGTHIYRPLPNTQGGIDALRQWCNAIAAGRVQAEALQLWTAAMLRPFYKSDGVAIRPVVCGEALFKFAMAASFSTCREAVDRAFGPDQFGARKQDGAGQMIAQVQAALMLSPDEVVVCIDATNAVGSVLRSTLWKAALD